MLFILSFVSLSGKQLGGYILVYCVLLCLFHLSEQLSEAKFLKFFPKKECGSDGDQAGLAHP